jgi:uncharacterized protein YbcC (UPF0753/DUF2309 family)
MVGVCRVKITESAEELKELMHQQPHAWGKERVQMLYLLQSRQAESVIQTAKLLGRGRITLQRWLAAYAEGGWFGFWSNLRRPVGSVRFRQRRKPPSWSDWRPRWGLAAMAKFRIGSKPITSMR